MMQRINVTRRCVRALAVGALAILMTSAATAAKISTSEIVAEIDVAAYRHNLDNLLYTHPGDDRGFGPEHDLARQNIEEHFDDLGLTVTLHGFQYQAQTYYNVVAVKTGVVTPEQQYVIGAHFDSVGNPGADDDGSGTAGVMEITRALADYRFESTIVFIAFDREEQGLVGSDAYATDHAGDDIRGMVEMDMIAYNTGAGTCDIYGRSASNPIKQALAQAVATYGGMGSVQQGQLDASDHAPFEWEGFQACLIIEDWGNPYYHTASDHVEMPNYIDYEYAADICRSVTGWLVDAAVVLPPDCPWDLSPDGGIGLADLTLLLNTWGDCTGCPEDLSGDDYVGVADLTILLNHWGPCP